LIKRLLAERGTSAADTSLNEMERLWAEAKRSERMDASTAPRAG